MKLVDDRAKEKGYQICKISKVVGKWAPVKVDKYGLCKTRLF
jgi:hypothetical protein